MTEAAVLVDRLAERLATARWQMHRQPTEAHRAAMLRLERLHRRAYRRLQRRWVSVFEETTP